MSTRVKKSTCNRINNFQTAGLKIIYKDRIIMDGVLILMIMIAGGVSTWGMIELFRWGHYRENKHEKGEEETFNTKEK